MSDEQTVYPIKAGLYGTLDQREVLFLEPGELLRSKGLPDTQEMRLAIYGAMSKACDEEGQTLILIEDDDVPSMEAFIKSTLNERKNDNDGQE